MAHASGRFFISRVFSFNNRFLNSCNNKGGGNVENSQKTTSTLKNYSSCIVEDAYPLSTAIIDFVISPLRLQGFQLLSTYLLARFPQCLKNRSSATLFHVKHCDKHIRIPPLHLANDLSQCFDFFPQHAVFLHLRFDVGDRVHCRGVVAVELLPDILVRDVKELPA